MALRFRHSGSVGDVLYSLPTLRAIGGGELFLIPDMAGKFQVVHPYGDSRMPREAAEWLVPLLEQQPYIQEALVATGRNVMVRCDYDLDEWRDAAPLTMMGLMLSERYLAFYDIFVDLGDVWLRCNANPEAEGHVVIQRTQRYQNPKVDYSVLRDVSLPKLFVGYPQEYEAFCGEYGFQDIRYVVVSNFLEMAELIQGCQLFLGNQSCGFAIAEGLKKPRIQETFSRASDCRPFGDGGHIVLNTDYLTHALSAVGVYEPRDDGWGDE